MQSERLIQRGLLILVALMPFHAFLSVWLGHLTGHQALIQAWKEVLLLVLSIPAGFLLVRSAETRDRLRTWPALLAGAFTALALLVTLVAQPSLETAAFGAKTDLEFLVAFMLAILVATPGFIKQLILAILIPACLVVGFNVLQVTVLPPDFLAQFGYGPNTIAPYQTLGTALKNLRFGATLGGPNQLGTYLMLPLTLALTLVFRRRQWIWLILAGGCIFGLIHTYSRAAWIGAFVAVAAVVVMVSPRRLRLRIGIALAALTAAASAAGLYLLRAGSSLQHYIFHADTSAPSLHSSDQDHLLSLQQGLTSTATAPLGHGLGTAGPAAFHTGTGLVIEDNSLQISSETGVLGAALFLALIASTIIELARKSAATELAPAALATILGVSITALVLPAWTDSTTALVTWTAAGAVIGARNTRHRYV